MRLRPDQDVTHRRPSTSSRNPYPISRSDPSVPGATVSKPTPIVSQRTSSKSTADHPGSTNQPTFVMKSHTTFKSNTMRRHQAVCSLGSMIGSSGRLGALGLRLLVRGLFHPAAQPKSQRCRKNTSTGKDVHYWGDLRHHLKVPRFFSWIYMYNYE